MKKKILDLAVIGSGLSALNFADEYSKSGKRINIISYKNEKMLTENNYGKLKDLPTQMRGKMNNVKNYFHSNNLIVENDCKVLGSLDFGGLSNYWGLQIDGYINNDQKINRKIFSSIENHFLKFLKKYNLVGSYFNNKNFLYKKDFKIPHQFESLIHKKNSNFYCKKPILGFFNQSKFKGDLNLINEKRSKLNSKNFFNNIKNNKKIIFHDYYVNKIFKKKDLFKVQCKNKNEEKNFYVKKLVLASGTIATTKLVADYLNYSKEIKIKHHPRLLSVFFSKKPIKFNLNFTPSILQIISSSKKDCYSADVRPGNKLITESIVEAFPFLKPAKLILNFFRHRTIFSNILLDTKYSNIFLRKNGKKFKLYCKKLNKKNLFNIKTKNIFKFLLTNQIIFPIYYSIFPGFGADYHYFGSIPLNGKGSLSVDNNCKLKGSKNIYVVDSSVFNFKTNKYPLGIMIANARRIGEHLSKI